LAQSLDGKVALVTGGATGIGAAVSLAFAENGAEIVVNHWQKSVEAEEVVTAIEKLGSRAQALECDVSSHSAVAEMVSQALEVFGKIDILVNCAGVTSDGVIWKMSESDWDEVIAVNLKGCFNLINAVSPSMRKQKSGKIVNISSINGLRGKFGQANYAASKAGMIGLTKSVARELGASNINVNVVAPGMILTAMMADLPEEIRQKALDETALGRLGEPEDVAGVVLFLCSEQARHITGEVIKVDGGQYM
jgi:3-oxoacyl-[acyl-carrier protein] reductase